MRLIARPASANLTPKKHHSTGGGGANGMLAKMKGIHRVRKPLSGGRVRYYYYAWRGGPMFWAADDRPVPEPVPQAFKDAYDKTVNPDTEGESEPVTPKTVDEMIADFKRLYLPKRVGAGTRENYIRSLALISKEFGKDELAIFEDKETRKDVKAWHRSFSATPRAADHNLVALVKLLNFAVDESDLSHHCAYGIERLYESDRSDIVWEPHELVSLYPHLPNEETRIAVEFDSVTGFRLGDLVRVPLSAIKAKHIEFKTSKSRKRIEIVVPILKRTRELLNRLQEIRTERAKKGRPVLATTILFNSRGRPWTERGLTWNFRKARDKTDIEKHFHDLRGTAATNLMTGPGRLTDDQIAEIMGWSKDFVQGIRRKYVSRKSIIAGVIRQIEGTPRERKM